MSLPDESTHLVTHLLRADLHQLISKAISGHYYTQRSQLLQLIEDSPDR